MNLARIFIERPVATAVLTLALALYGVFAFRALPINDLPNVDFPALSVSASLPGADPETMAATVATPLEREFSTVTGLIDIASQSSAGSTRISLTFDLSRDIDAAAQDVQNAIAQAARRLPDGMELPTLRKVNPADQAVLYLALTARHMPLSQLDEYAETRVAPRLSTVPGVAQVLVYGGQKYAVRLYLDPQRLAQRGLSLADVVQAVQQANSHLPAGSLTGATRSYTVAAEAGLAAAEEFGEIIVAWRDGAPVRIRDLGRAEDSVANDDRRTWYNDARAIVLAVQRQPGANTVALADGVREQLAQLRGELPSGVALDVLYDRADYIRASIEEVELTLVLAVLLVIGVIWLFLRRPSAVAIAALVLPASVLGTFAVMWLLGYSLNNLSLMALTLAVGFVVDDAIVVLENIARHVEQGKDRRRAALDGAREIGFTVLSMTASLAAVFIPILFMGGILGRLFGEFAVTVAVAVVISGLVSLSLTPMLCARWLRVGALAPNAFERGFERLRVAYGRTLTVAVRHHGLMLLIALGVLALNVWLFQIVPQGFIPRIDTGQISGNTRAPEGIVFEELSRRQQAIAARVQAHPDVAAVMSTAGQSYGGAAGGNVGRIVVRLQPLGERSASADEIIEQLRRATQAVPGIRLFLQNPPAINLGGMGGQSDYQFVLQGLDLKALYTAAEAFERVLRAEPLVEDVGSDLELRNPQIEVRILRERAAALDVTPQQIQQTLLYAYGGQEVSRIYGATDQYPVVLELDARYQTDINALAALYVPTRTGGQVPLASVAEIGRSVGPVSVSHHGQLPSVGLSFSAAEGVALGDVVQRVTGLARAELPTGITGRFVGAAESFQESLVTLPLLLALTILVIYMILAMLYEHFGHPLTILTALPLAGVGALLALLLLDQELNIFSFVGLILLVGLVKKNGIMMVDFALAAQRERGLPPQQAIVEASLTRFRPIMMTTLAAIVATLPIALGYGPGAEARRPLGIAVLGGLALSQLLTLYLTPAFYVSLDHAARWLRREPKSPVTAGESSVS